jgi:tetratricopeptide (TPR) repeat protein
MGRTILLRVALLLVVSPAQAQTPDPVTPTTPGEFEQSRQMFEKGQRAYERGDYEIALMRFQSALAAAPSGETHFNIARCYERLGRWELAAKSYEEYLKDKPPNEGAELREKIADLRVRATEAKAAQPQAVIVSAPPRSLRVPAIVMLVATVALAGAGAGAYFSEWSDYQSRRDSCGGQCSPESLEQLRNRVQVAEISGGVLWALAGASLVADVVLWVLDSKHPRERKVSTRAGGLEVRF